MLRGEESPSEPKPGILSVQYDRYGLSQNTTRQPGAHYKRFGFLTENKFLLSKVTGCVPIISVGADARGVNIQAPCFCSNYRTLRLLPALMVLGAP